MSHFYIVASNQFGLYMFSQGRWNQGTGDQRAGGHCVLKWGFMRTFHGNQDVTVKLKSELIFVKGVFSKPSGKYIVVPNLCFLS